MNYINKAILTSNPLVTAVFRSKRFALMMGVLVTAMVLLSSCASFKAERVDDAKADEHAMDITDNWVDGDTIRAIDGTMKQIYDHKRFIEFQSRFTSKRIKVFVGEIRNNTAESYFPVKDLEDALLEKMSNSDQFTLIDASRRDALLKEITYQNDGMVDPKQAKKIGKQSGADVMIFGDINMKPESRNGKTIKTYTVNLRLTEIETSEEIARAREKINKFSKNNGSSW
jgi:PBP1b-binding outer membrane lipoprotein LpoB